MTITTHPAFTTGTWKLDLSHSELAFSIRHLAISKVRGTFDAFDVTVVTSENPAETSVQATIEIASVNTKQADRDGHLRTGDFFLAEEFPTATFSSTVITLDGDDFIVVGDFTLRGVTKQIELRGEFGGITVDGYGQTKAGATVTTKINRQDFGVNWNAVLEAGGLTLGDQVTISAEIALVLQP